MTPNELPRATLFGTAAANSNVVFFLKTDDPLPWHDRTTLFVGGGTVPNAVGMATLFTAGLLRGESMPLFLAGSPSDVVVRNLNMWVGGEYPSAREALPLMVANNVRGLSGGTDLFIRVGGTLTGGQESHSSLVLYLKRPLEAGVSLFLAGPGEPSDDSMTLFVAGDLGMSAFVTLAVPNVAGKSHDSMVLYTHGW